MISEITRHKVKLDNVVIKDVLCQEQININTRVSTYCMLSKGHTGEHDSEPNVVKDKRCKSESPYNGARCGLPYNHYGQHSVSMAQRAW